MEYVSEVRKLSDLFYANYPRNLYPEIAQKKTRAYAALLIDRHDDYLICIPFRSNITHGNAYVFRNTARSKRSRSGLDYTKICIIKKTNYIDDSPGIIDADEYREMRMNLDEIVMQACQYVDRYILHVKGISVLSKREYRKQYWYTTLKYFHNELGISITTV